MDSDWWYQPDAIHVTGEARTINDCGHLLAGTLVELRRYFKSTCQYEVRWQRRKYLISASDLSLLGQSTGSAPITTMANPDTLPPAPPAVNPARFGVCECGSHKAGVDKHSDYCPLYVAD